MSDFFENGFKMVPLKTWLGWVSGRDERGEEPSDKVFIALPMIQRGSVWKPSQIIGLWDSLLRGMPVGSLMLSHMAHLNSDDKPVLVRRLGKKDPEELPVTGGWGLLDGQQRTLAMLAGWPHVQINKTIWVDFSDKPDAENLFRFHITSTNQKFGFQRKSPHSKLALHERALASRYERYESGASEENKNHIAREQPWDANLPIKISDLILHRLQEGNLHDFVNKILAIRIESLEKVINRLSGTEEGNLLKLASKNLDLIKSEDIKNTIYKNVENFSFRLNRILRACQIPLIEVNKEIFDEINHADVDPALAILFKRIGAGGTALSDADYVYSVIKHRLPEAYALIEKIAEKKSIIQHHNATNIVMTAVRLTVAQIEGGSDYESPTKKDFHKIISDINFSARFKNNIVNESLFVSSLNNITEALSFKGKDDIGLPLHSFILIDRPLSQIILRWIMTVNPADQEKYLENNRQELIRFILYWVLCVKDSKKASAILFKKFQNKDSENLFQGGEYAQLLQNEGVAIPLIRPADFEVEKINSIILSEKRKGLVGWKRFDRNKNGEEGDKHYSRCVDLYARWWSLRGSHVHPILLWLQRDVVSTFTESISPDSEDDTPYDFDHICPSNQWSNWTGRQDESSLFHWHKDSGDKQGHWRLGNSIGNIRILNSSTNRSYGDAPPAEKLYLGENDKLKENFPYQTDIHEDEYLSWIGCSVTDRVWNQDSASDFQNAIELRAFHLYKKFYKDLNFSSDYEWKPKE